MLMISRRPTVRGPRSSGSDVRLTSARLLFVIGTLAAGACGGNSPGSQPLTPEKAADLIRRDTKFGQPLDVAGKILCTRSLVGSRR